MDNTNTCFGHDVRIARGNKIIKATKSPPRNLDRDKVVLIKMGPTSKETSLKELEENYSSKPEWRNVRRSVILYRELLGINFYSLCKKS